jgi:hypothetical protein
MKTVVPSPTSSEEEFRRLKVRLKRHGLKYPTLLRVDMKKIRTSPPRKGRSHYVNTGPKGPLFVRASYKNAYVRNLNLLGSTEWHYHGKVRFLAHVLTQESCPRILHRIMRLYEYLRKGKPHGFFRHLDACITTIWNLRSRSEVDSHLELTAAM